MTIAFDGIVLVIFSAILIVLLIYLKIKKKKSIIYLLFFAMFYLYICHVLKYTQFPIHFIKEMKEAMGQNVWYLINYRPLIDLRARDVKTSLLNIIMTIPFGFGLPFVKKLNLKRMCFYGLLFCISLELMQFISALLAGFTFRRIDINDVIFNFAGIMVGYLCFKLFSLLFKWVVKIFNIKLNFFLKYISECM